MGKFSLFILFLIIFCNNLFSQTLAFPEAEGFGASSVGGRGGVVIKVTNLDPFGPGGLQEALDVNEPRVIVFSVSGVIRCSTDLVIQYPNVYIAGQTAPGAGITIEGRLNGWNQDLHDVTIRFLRFRPKRPEPENYSQGDCVSLGRSTNCIVDHCSFAWGTDEVFDIYEANNWTVQWSTFEESDAIDGHNYGFINRSANSGNISVHHNLFAHHLRRAPCVSPADMESPGDIRNNVIYNVNQCYVHDGERTGVVNIIGNYFKHGPTHDRIFPIAAYADGTYYIAGNYLAHFQGLDYGYFGNLSSGETFDPTWVQYNYLGTKLENPVDVPYVNTHTAVEAYNLVLDQAGCFPRDRVTRRTVSEVINGTGNADRNADLELMDDWFLEGLIPSLPPVDTDDDGMPDLWENDNSLNPNIQDHNTIMMSGYTAIEEYINELAQELISGTATGEKRINRTDFSTSFSLLQNYPNPFNSSSTIEYRLPYPGNVDVKVYNVKGQMVDNVFSGKQSGGLHKQKYSAGELTSGVYFYKIEFQETFLVKKMLLIK